MIIYCGFDDTDILGHTMGTGRLVREFCYRLPEGCRTVGVLRHQLPKLPDIPFTSNNSSACAIIDVDDASMIDALRDLAVAWLAEKYVEGSDPGLCVAFENQVPDGLVNYSLEATGRRKTQAEAMEATRGLTLLGLGGTNDGVIGASAAVGLTRHGWCGRFIEYGRLRDLTEPLRVGDLTNIGIRVVSVDRDPAVPLPDDIMADGAWIRPSLFAGGPVLQVVSEGRGAWRTAHGKHRAPAPQGERKAA